MVETYYDAMAHSDGVEQDAKQVMAVFENNQRPKAMSDFEKLQVSEERSGETVRVRSTDNIGTADPFVGFVDADGSVRQETTGAWLNQEHYEIAEIIEE